MKSLNLIVLASAALLAGAAVPAVALDLGVGGVTVSGGSTAAAARRSRPAPATPRPTSRSAAARTSPPSARAPAGPAPASPSAIPAAIWSALNDTDAAVNLGSLGLGSGINDTLNGVTGPLGTTLDGTDLGGLPGGGGGGGGGGSRGARVAAAFGGLSAGRPAADRAEVPRGASAARPSYSAETLALCRLLAAR